MKPDAHLGTREQISRDLLQLSTLVVTATGPSGPGPMIKLSNFKHLAVVSKTMVSMCFPEQHHRKGKGKDPSVTSHPS